MLNFFSTSTKSGLVVGKSYLHPSTLCFARPWSLQRLNLDCVRYYAAAAPKRKVESKSLTESSGQDGAVTLSLGEKVKENAKTGGYGLVVVAGLLVTGSLLYVVLSELFSAESPNNIYTHAFKLCKLSQELQDALGTPIKCYGEETRRGWRRHVSHVEFIQGNVKYLRMKFYVEGPFGKATVNVEKKKNEGGKYEYSYLLVDVDYPPRRINVHF